jgi:formamidopyrimidine-DNA glycosylase
MPELPEVETIANGLHKRVAGDVIESVWLGEKPEPLKSPAQEIARTIEHTRIERVRRVGKHIAFDLVPLRKTNIGPSTQSPAAQFIVHLGMTGNMLVREAEAQPAKHTHAIAKLRSGRELHFVDPRRFGRLAVAHGFTGPGTEPLTISAQDFAQLFHKRKTAIKAALLNQKLLHGVGNIYADESLFRAGIRPRRRADSLTRAELARLHRAVQEVLREAIELGGSSVSDYVNESGEEGFFQLQHRVYLRTGEPCLTCGTPIKRIALAGRGTHYCPKCQR